MTRHHAAPSFPTSTPSKIRAALVSLTLLLSACGSGPQTPGTPSNTSSSTPPVDHSLQEVSLNPRLCSFLQDMYVVAHADDDLLFMNPDLRYSIRNDHCVLTVFLTRGDNPVGIQRYNQVYGTSITPAEYAQSRENGIKAAYAQMAGVSNVWIAGAFYTSNGKRITAYSLRDEPRVVVAFMRLPEAASKSVDSSIVTLDDLYFGYAPSTTSSDGVTYTSEELTDSLTYLIKLSEPKFFHIQDSDPDPFIRDGQGNIIGDHVDHIVGARFALRARERATNIPPHSLIRYRDYNTNAETTENLSSSATYDKGKTFGLYVKHDPLLCPPNTNCADSTTFSNWLAADFRGWLKRQYFNIADDQEGSVVRDADGNLDVFMTGERTSTIRTISQVSNTTNTWNTWTDLRGNFSSKPVAGTYRDGRMTVFTRSNSGQLLFRTQTSQTGPWSAWQNLGGDGVSNPALVRAPWTGLLQVFVVSGGGQMYTSLDTTGYGNWSPFSSLGSFSGFKVWSDPAVARMSSGRTTIFVRDDQGNVRYITQYLSGMLWSGWTLLGQGFKSEPVAEATTNGKIDLFMRGNDNGLYTRQQSDWDTWTPWKKLEFGALQFTGKPVVTTNASGRTDVFVRDMDNSIVRFTRLSPDAAWNTPERLPTDVRSQAILGAQYDGAGALHVVVRSPDGNVYDTTTKEAIGGWTAWQNLGN